MSENIVPQLKQKEKRHVATFAVLESLFGKTLGSSKNV